MHLIHTSIIQPVVVFAETHDDQRWFRLWFTISIIFAGVVLNMGVFALLVALHMALDIIKYRSRHTLNWYWTIIETVRESLIDMFFITFGLLLAVVFHHSVAIGGLGSLAQAEVLLLNLILRVGPRLKIAEHILEVVMHWRHHFLEEHRHNTPLSRGEKFLCLATIICAGSVFLTPFVTTLEMADVVRTMQHELMPSLEIHIVETLQTL